MRKRTFSASDILMRPFLSKSMALNKFFMNSSDLEDDDDDDDDEDVDDVVDDVVDTDTDADDTDLRELPGDLRRFAAAAAAIAADTDDSSPTLPLS